MKEEFLHYVWKNKLIDASNIKTTNGEPLTILNFGYHNQNSGPDFLNAKIELDGQTWYGNIEIHIASSDWYLHHHETDSNYDAIILHVVWSYNQEVYGKNNQPLPTLEIKQYVDAKLVNNFDQLSKQNLNWIACEKQICHVPLLIIDKWLERLFVERLERKSLQIEQLLLSTKNDWESVLFILLAQNFGLKVNTEAFLNLAKSVPFSIIRKEQNNQTVLTSLLFGQAGFLNEYIEDSYHVSLRKTYRYLKHKYRLIPIQKNQFQFFRMRPSNFPTIRIAQLAALYSKRQYLFTELISMEHIKQLYKLFDISLDAFWEKHYTFTKESKKSSKKLTISFLNLIIINTIIPLRFCYLKARNQLDNISTLIDLMQQLGPEKNAVISKFSEIGIKAGNAFESQALLELKNNYCAPKQCLQCAIGNQLLKTDVIF